MSGPEPIRVEAAGVSLRAVAAGPADGPLVILLHGFPETSWGWHRQVAPLAAAGFRVVVPDQRGYAESDKPAGIVAYAIPHLVADVLAIADRMGAGRFRLAGHDWGAMVAWCAALYHPERVERLAILNVPHPRVFRRFLRSDVRQMSRSWYTLAMQLPGVPEFLLGLGDHAALVRSLRRSSRPGTFGSADLDRYRRAWSRPGALTGMVNWYRAAARHPPPPVDPVVRVPTRILWGRRDAFLLPEMAEASLEFCPEGALTSFPDATHWVQHEEPERVAEALVEHFAA